MKNLFLVAVFLISTLSFGQGQSEYVLPNYNPFLLTSNFYDIPLMSVLLKGSPYVAPDFKSGTVIINGKNEFTAPMRYNAAKEVIEFLEDGKNQKELLRRPYVKANIDGKLYEILEYSDNGKKKLGYFNPLKNNGEIQFLTRPRKIVVEDEARRSVSEVSYYYQDVSSYYIKNGDRPAEKVTLNKRNILKYFKDKSSELAHYIAAYGLNLRKEEDVIRVVNYYNLVLSPDQKEMQS